jgi:dipeptidyl aminopeptidase/acylaminoacyl peptidase
VEKQITNFNDELLKEYDFRPAEQFWVDGAGGKKMHVFMVKPHNFDENKKYPVILNVHGGPQSQWMDSFRGDWQVYPGSGYIVIFPNPHGSTGYGQEYTSAISGDWGGKVYEDLMLLMDEVEKMPFVDKDRIGAMGWSFGGYMMNWFQGKTKRFKCLASMMGIFDLESMWGATEELWFVNWDLKGQPWNSDLYEKYSPSNYIGNFSTPALIITGEKDYRVPYFQSIQYFTTLKTLGIDSRLIIFENDGHWPAHVKSMPLYYNAHLEWFNKYLGGDPAPYDSKKLITNTAFE